MKWELGARCKVQDRSPRRKKGEAFLGEDCDAADCDSFCELTTCTEKLHRAVEVLVSPGLCSSGPLSKHYVLQGSSKGGLGSFAEQNLPQKFDSANSGPVGRGKGFPGTNHHMCGQVLLVLRVRAALVGRCRKLLFLVATSAQPHLQLPSCQQDHRAFPASLGSLRLAGAEQGVERGCGTSTCCAGVASARPEGLPLPGSVCLDRED